jgi:hypothetical protein
MDMKKKLAELLDGTDFWVDADCDSAERLMKLGEHNMEEYDGMGKERQQRTHDLICLVLAEVLQPQARDKYGDISDSSVRKVLVDEFTEPESKLGWEKWKQLAKQAMTNQGFSHYQLGQIYQIFDLMPHIIIEFIVEGVSRFRLVPRADAAKIAIVLREMFAEVNYANGIRNN